MDGSLVGPPDRLRIPHDRHRFEYVGRLPDGRQFMAFVTGAFPDGVKLNWDTDEWRKVKRWIAVLHLFDAEGKRLGTETRVGGFDIEGRDVAGQKAWAELDEMLSRLGPGELKPADIWVREFSVTIDGVTHSLLYKKVQPEEDGPVFESVMLEPRDIMFHPPWDSGEYSTQRAKGVPCASTRNRTSFPSTPWGDATSPRFLAPLSPSGGTGRK
jgi:hypothetical protein